MAVQPLPERSITYTAHNGQCPAYYCH